MLFTVQKNQSADPFEENEQGLPGSVSGIKRLIATPPTAASTGYHTDAQHPKELQQHRIHNLQSTVLYKYNLIQIFTYSEKHLLK